MLFNYDKYNTQSLADILAEASRSIEGTAVRMYASPRESIIQQLDYYLKKGQQCLDTK
jgi:hypothetical protein